MKDINIQSPDPAERDWEYDGDGTRIYKIEMGKPLKTLYNDEYESWKAKYGHEWESEETTYKGVDEPYYVGLP